MMNYRNRHRLDLKFVGMLNLKSIEVNLFVEVIL